MKSRIILLTVLFITSVISSVKSQNKYELIRTLNQKAGETVGNLKIVNGKRFIVDGAELTYNGDLVTIAFEVDKTRYFYEFNPAAISTVEDGTMDANSAVGVVVITLDDPVARHTVFEKKNQTTNKYQYKVYFNYLKKDKDNLYIIKSAFNKLSDLCNEEMKNIPLIEQLNFMSTEDEIWTAGKKESVSYKLKDQFFMGCHIYIYYSVTRSTLQGDYTGNYLTIVPATAIDGLTLMKKNTRPESFFLEASKAGFDTYEQKKGSVEYTYVSTVETIPFFIKNNLRTENEKFLQDLNAAIIRCRGDRVRIRVAD